MTGADMESSLDNGQVDEPIAETVVLRPERSDLGLRLDKYVSGELPDLSRTYLQDLIERGHVRVDGFVRRTSFKITPGQVVTVSIPERVEVELLPEEIDLDFLYIDNDIVVVNKPAGMVVHPAVGHGSGTLVNALLHHFPDISIAGTFRPGLVHRLDKDTSGVIVAARNDRAMNALVRQWQDRTVEKLYQTLVAGVFEEVEGTVDAPIGRDPVHRQRMAVRRDGRDATTHFTVGERFKESTLLDVQIETGRTHQIRVHMAMTGHPVIGDQVYGNATSQRLATAFDVPRQFLHAASLSFLLPDGKPVTFEAPLADDLVAVLERVREADDE